MWSWGQGFQRYLNREYVIVALSSAEIGVVSATLTPGQVACIQYKRRKRGLLFPFAPVAFAVFGHCELLHFCHAILPWSQMIID